MTTTTKTSEFQIYFGHERILEKISFISLNKVFEAISENLFMFNNECFEFTENSITIEIVTEDENQNFTYDKFLKIPVSKFDLIKKMHLHI
jgi:hypothetical protein